jgi:hypothetical protein
MASLSPCQYLPLDDTNLMGSLAIFSSLFVTTNYIGNADRSEKSGIHLNQ